MRKRRGRRPAPTGRGICMTLLVLSVLLCLPGCAKWRRVVVVGCPPPPVLPEQGVLEYGAQCNDCRWFDGFLAEYQVYMEKYWDRR